MADMMEMKYGIPDIDRFSRRCFYVGVGIGVLFLLAFFGIYLTGMDFRRLGQGCLFHQITGFYCFGCGGTRSCYALLQGKLILSLCYHPAVPYFLTGYLLFMASHALNIIMKGRVRALRFCPPFFYVGIGLLFLQFFIKNIVLWQGLDLLQWVDQFALSG